MKITDFDARLLRYIMAEVGIDRHSRNELRRAFIVSVGRIALKHFRELDTDDPDFVDWNGATIAIGGFGASSVSLASLRSRPAQTLRIGRMFTDAMVRGKASAMQVKAIIDLAHSVGMTVTAEAVETRESLALLQNMGADAVQGPVISRAMPLAEFMKFDAPALSPARPAATLKGLA